MVRRHVLGCDQRQGWLREISITRRRRRGTFPCAALDQDQPVGNDRFYRELEAMTGRRIDLRKRGRLRKQDKQASADDTGQGELPL
jgi:hypothetical protein